MTETGKEIESKLKLLFNEEQARHLMRFFRTGPGEYGEGDKFLGIKVPITRSTVKEYRKSAEIGDAVYLIGSEWHEIRLAGFLLLIEIFNREKGKNEKQIIDTYLSLIERGNNWDLVDLVAPKILGKYLICHPEEESILDTLADMDGHLWHQRVAVVANLTIIRNGNFESTMRIAKKMLNHPHDLIHKATGWMLREAGKNGGKKELVDFLDHYAQEMPRTMLRYALEHFSESQRKHYMCKYV